MSRMDWIPSLFLVVLSVFVIAAVKDLPYSSEYGPGPAFMPMWLASIMGGLSLIMMVQSLRSRVAGKPFFENRTGMKKAALVAGLFLAYILLLQFLGLLVALALFLVILLLWVERRSWAMAFFAAGAVSISCYLLFEVWLKVPLPIGVLGI